MSFRDRLLKSWQRADGLTIVLWPLSVVYRCLFAMNKLRYRFGFAASYRAPVPVIVVGNISVGGTGKTPLVVFLVEALREAGYTPGVISRGYGGRSDRYPVLVDFNTPAEVCGDEPALIVRRTGVPLCVGPDRSASIKLLLKNNEIDVVVSDDGLQHFAMQRDIEICLIDKTSPQTNHFLLPAGPYREGKSRLSSIDFLVSHRTQENSDGGVSMRLEAGKVQPVVDTNTREFPEDQRIHAIAGIGNPQRFFTTCTRLGLQFDEHVFPDHHRFRKSDIDFAGAAVLMTEKDAVKCQEIADHCHWYLPVDAKLSAGFIEQLIKKL